MCVFKGEDGDQCAILLCKRDCHPSLCSMVPVDISTVKVYTMHYCRNTVIQFTYCLTVSENWTRVNSVCVVETALDKSL